MYAGQCRAGVDAYIKEIDDGFEVVPEIEGTKIDRDKLMEDIKMLLLPAGQLQIWKKTDVT